MYVQDRINREVVNVTTLPITAELAGLLQAASGLQTHGYTNIGALVSSKKYNS